MSLNLSLPSPSSKLYTIRGVYREGGGGGGGWAAARAAGRGGGGAGGWGGGGAGAGRRGGGGVVGRDGDSYQRVHVGKHTQPSAVNGSEGRVTRRARSLSRLSLSPSLSAHSSLSG